MYIIHDKAYLFGLDVLELLRLMHKVVCIGLGHEPALIRFLDEVFITLLLGKGNGILFRFEIDVGALHAVRRRLPSHERVLPPVALLQNVPIHAPVVCVPVSRLSCGLCGAVDAAENEGQYTSWDLTPLDDCQRTGQCGPGGR